MTNTPISMRTHVAIFGNTNAGKSTLFNALTGQEAAIVSDKPGTTTDPVIKAMELIPYGPIALIDTAGLGDMSDIGRQRMERTNRILKRTDFALYAADINRFNEEDYENAKRLFKKYRIHHMLVFTKCEDVKTDGRYPKAAFVSIHDPSSIEELRTRLSQELSKLDEEPQTMIGDLLPAGSLTVMVVPIDSEAPKGRLILPQVQFLRDCLDHGIKAVVVRETELKEVMAEIRKPDLVVVDSQVFKYVASVIPEDVMLTSFSVLMARMKGDISKLARGAEAVASLKDGSRILMAEACTHNSSHEDIGRVKIPALLRKYTGKQLEFEYSVHHDFPEDIAKYDLVIHCGGCMINSRAMNNRIRFCEENNVPITNYGLVIALVSGILERSMKILKK